MLSDNSAVPLIITVCLSRCLAASVAVFKHWDTQVSHLVPSRDDIHDMSCTTKSFPESVGQINSCQLKVNFFHIISYTGIY